MKKRLFSGIQPSGNLHIGNYLGAITQFEKMQKDYDSIFCIVDLHAITVPQDPKKLKENIFSLSAWYLASGIDPEKSTLFIQSHIKEHTELAWILNTITSIGDLSRMTQLKSKAQYIIDDFEQVLRLSYKKMLEDGPMIRRNTQEKISNEKISQLTAEAVTTSAANIFKKYLKNYNKISFGLFDYPVLMAADILLYQTDIVPVGNDQKQHVELTRNLATRFNNKFGQTFKIPDVKMKESGSRIMSLDNPAKKMSKSTESEGSYILLKDSPDLIRKKISRAVTDNENTISFDPKRAGIYNLLTIYENFSGLDKKEIENKFNNSGYGDFKKDLAELIIEKLTPIQNKYRKLIADKSYLDKILHEGAKKAQPIAQEKLNEVKKKLGFIL